MIRATFVMEQHIGHLTYYRNIRRFVDVSEDIQATWVPVTYSSPGAIWERLPFPKHIQGSLCGRSQVREGLRQGESDVVFFNTQVPAALGGTLVYRRPYVISTDITPIQYDEMSQQYGHRPDRPGLVKLYKHRVNVALLQKAARLFPWSTWTRYSLMSDYGVDPARIEVVPPGVDMQQWNPVARQNGGPLRILFVGGDLYRKGGDLLLRAFQSLPRGSAELILVTRSSTPRQEGIRSYHDLQPNSPELIDLFKTSDVFVLPTAAEAFGIAAVEASAAGLASIVTAVGGLTDIVVDGETGFLIPSGDVDALTNRLHRLIVESDLREQFGKAARLRAETYFDARRNTERIIAGLLDVAERAALKRATTRTAT